jgi:hypothetical protein
METIMRVFRGLGVDARIHIDNRGVDIAVA